MTHLLDAAAAGDRRLGSIFENLDPKEIAKAERPLQAILVEKLDQAVAQLEGESIGDPLVVAAMQDRFGTSLLGLGEPGKAIVLLEKARATRQAKLGPEHPDTLAAMSNLATTYEEAGKLDLALPLLEETLQLEKAKLGPDHPRTLTSMHNLAAAYQAVGKLDLALPLMEKTLALCKAKLGPEHPSTLGSMGGLGHLYCLAGQGEKAATTLKQFTAGMRKQSPPNSTRFAGLLAQFALDLLKVGQYPTTEEMLRECLAIREKTQPDAWTTFNAQSLLGGALLGQKKYADAEPLLLKGYEGMKKQQAKIPAPGKIRLVEAALRLVQLYEATGKKDEAAKWQKELDAIKTPQKKLEKQP